MAEMKQQKKDKTHISGDNDSVIYGGIGDDEVFVTGGDNTIDVGYGADYVSGGSGSDAIYAGAGSDLVNGRGGNDETTRHLVTITAEVVKALTHSLLRVVMTRSYFFGSRQSKTLLAAVIKLMVSRMSKSLAGTISSMEIVRQRNLNLSEWMC